MEHIGESIRVEYFRRRSASSIESEFIYKRVSRRTNHGAVNKNRMSRIWRRNFRNYRLVNERERSARTCTIAARIVARRHDETRAKTTLSDLFVFDMVFIERSSDVARASCVYMQMVNRLLSSNGAGNGLHNIQRS